MQGLLTIGLLTGVGALVGFLTSGIARYLDFLMTKGHFLDFIREGAGRRAARKGGMEGLFDVPETESWQDRAEMYDQIYWHVAKERKWFTIWICVYCLSGWVLYPVFGFAVWYFGLGLWEAVIAFLLSVVFNFQFLNWLS